MTTTGSKTRMRMTEWQEIRVGQRDRERERDKQPAEVERKAL